MATLRTCALAALLGLVGCGDGSQDSALVDVHGGTTTDAMSLGEATLDGESTRSCSTADRSARSRGWRRRLRAQAF